MSQIVESDPAGELFATPEQKAKFTQAAVVAAYAWQSTGIRLPAIRVKADKYDPCPCGSGKKFKFCCWTPGATS